MSACTWCRRENADVRVEFSHADLAIELCPMCARLLAPGLFLSDLHDDDLDVLDVARGALDQRLAEVYASGEGSSDHCWWCERPGAPWNSTVRADGVVLFDSPVLCDECVGLSGHVGGGFAYIDAAWEAACIRVLDVVARERRPPVKTLRGVREELLLAKLALLERDGLLDYPEDAFAELRASLGLAEEETRAQVLRLWAQPDSPVTFARVDGCLTPKLSAAGRARLSELRTACRSGSRDGALRSAALRRALARLDEKAALGVR